MPATVASCVVMRAIEDLTPCPHNPRTHPRAQIRRLTKSIRKFGFAGVISVNPEGMVIAGNALLEAAIKAGLSEVPTICLEGFSPDEIRAFVIAANRTALDAGWDLELLRIEFQNLILNTDIDIELTGFEIGEIDIIIGAEPALDSSDDSIPVEKGPTVARLGDVWRLLNHRIYCADAREDYGPLMRTERAHTVWADPPYNCPIDGHAMGKGSIHHPDFAMASGEMSREEFIEFLTAALSQVARWTTLGSVHFVCMDWRNMFELLTAGEQVYDSLLNVCVWDKDKGGMGSLYRSEHELVFVFKNGKAPHRNNVQLGRFGRNRTNVWKYPGVNTASRSGDEGNLLALHPTVKPVAMIADALLDCSARGEIVLDPFLGSGSTLLAAERVGRICYGIEIEPIYVDTAIARWQRLTGENAIHSQSGRTFNELREEVGCVGTEL